MRTLWILILVAGTAAAQQVAPPLQPVNVVEAERRIVDLETKLAEARASHTEAHPTVLEYKSQLDRMKKQLSFLRANQAAGQANQARMQAEQDKVASRYGQLPDNWWRHAGVVTLLRLTAGQVKQMEDTFQQHRLKLIDLSANLEKEEATLEPLVAADKLDEGKLTSQIDRVAQARAELEKYRGRMLVGIRKVLEPEQWRKLNEMGFTVTSR